MVQSLLPAIHDPDLINELASLARFQRIENKILCRLASRASGCVILDRWRAIWVLRDHPSPLPVPVMEFRNARPPSVKPVSMDESIFRSFRKPSCILLQFPQP